MFDIHPATARLALRGKGFANSIEVANTNSGWIPMGFMDAMMVDLGNCSDALSCEVTSAILDLYIA